MPMAIHLLVYFFVAIHHRREPAYALPIMGSHMTVNGLNLWVQDSGPETAIKGTVLLFHGFPDTSDM